METREGEREGEGLFNQTGSVQFSHRCSSKSTFLILSTDGRTTATAAVFYVPDASETDLRGVCERGRRIMLFTWIGQKVGPRLRESRLLAPSGRGGEFTQPREHLLADPCRFG